MTFAIEANSLGKTFRTRNEAPTHAVVHLSLRIPVGQFVAVVGEPGAGKTTLLKLFGGQLRPTTGQTHLFGHDPSRDRSVARSLVQIRSNDAHALRVQQSPKELLSTIALSDESPILLVDEPTANLDDTDARAFLSLLRDVVRSLGKTAVLATRHVELAADFCDRILFLDRGRLAFDGATSDLRRVKSADVYRITVGGQLDDAWSDWFDGLRIVSAGVRTTVLMGPIVDQSALHGVLTKVRDLGLPLLALSRVEPGAGDVLRRLVCSRLTANELERPRGPGHTG